MNRYLMVITYDGKNFCGFQVQKNGRTVQGELQNALKILFKQDINCTGSGRTDAGVHALKQYVHFDINSQIDTEKTQKSLNGILPDDIKVLSLTKSSLHARYDAKAKTYVYKMYLSEIELPLYSGRMLKISPDINIKAMEKVCKYFVGKHDFKNFCAANSEVKTTVRTIFKCKLKQKGNLVELIICGDGFLYKMVRNIVGLMLQVGEGKIANKKQFKTVAFGKADGKQTVKTKNTAPGYALYLLDVIY